VIECDPTARLDIETTALDAAGPVPEAASVPVPTGVAPSIKVTEPVRATFGVVALCAVTVTVNRVTAPALAGFALAATAADVAILFTVSVSAAETLPA